MRKPRNTQELFALFNADLEMLARAGGKPGPVKSAMEHLGGHHVKPSTSVSVEIRREFGERPLIALYSYEAAIVVFDPLARVVYLNNEKYSITTTRHVSGWLHCPSNGYEFATLGLGLPMKFAFGRKEREDKKRAKLSRHISARELIAFVEGKGESEL